MVHPDNGVLGSTKKKWPVKPWRMRKHQWLLLSEKRQSENTVYFYESNHVFWKKGSYGHSKKTSGYQGIWMEEGWIGRVQRLFRVEAYSVRYYNGEYISYICQKP